MVQKEFAYQILNQQKKLHNIKEEKRLIDSQLLIGPVILSNAVQLG